MSNPEYSTECENSDVARTSCEQYVKEQRGGENNRYMITTFAHHHRSSQMSSGASNSKFNQFAHDEMKLLKEQNKQFAEKWNEAEKRLKDVIVERDALQDKLKNVNQILASVIEPVKDKLKEELDRGQG
jgi:hypothetical protein